MAHESHRDSRSDAAKCEEGAEGVPEAVDVHGSSHFVSFGDARHLDVAVEYADHGHFRGDSSLWYSRLKLEWAQLEAKARMIYMLREMRHSGVSLGLDTLKDKSIDADIRNLIDFLYLRKQGAAGLPEDLHYIYSYFDAEWMQRMPVNEFVVRTKEGDIGWGHCPWADWHKVEKENMRKIMGLQVNHSDPKETGDQGRSNAVSDEQHARIVTLYREVNPETGRQYSMAKIGKMLGRSPTTVQNQLVEHDVSVQAMGYCPRCRRAMTSK